jgi:predicted MFS family arabinose efflux permease
VVRIATTPGQATTPGSIRQRLLFPTLVLLSVLVSVIGSLGAPLIVEVSNHFEVSTLEALWTLSLPFLVGAAATPIIAWLASTRWLRSATITAVGVELVGCLLCALPLGFGYLLAGRALQGVGLGLVAVSISVARECLNGAVMTRAVATLSIVNVVAGAIGFPLAGFLVQVGGIRLAYWVAAVPTALTLLLTIYVLPGSTTVDGTRRVDWLGLALLSGGAAGLLLASARGAVWGLTSVTTIVVTAASTAAVTIWVWWSLRTPSPLLDVRLARQPLSLSVHMTSFFAGAGMYILLTLVVVLTQTPKATGWGMGLAVSVSGLVLVPYALLNFLGSRLSERLRRRLRPGLWLPVGCALYTVSAALLLVAHTRPWQAFAIMAVAGVASGMSFAQMPGLLVRAVPPTETGPAIGFSVVLRNLGFSAGSTIAGLVLSSREGSQGVTESAFEQGLRVALLFWLATTLIAWTAGRQRGSPERSPSARPCTAYRNLNSPVPEPE